MNALARAGEALNPIVVKEVRQALRGRYFRVVFLLALTLATTIGVLVVLVSSGSTMTQAIMGHTFFSWQFGVLSAAVLGFVPFSAFTSMSAEWEENTYDLLVLSNLRPRQLVLGKLASALTQAGLFYATFTPFIVFAFLLNGVDLLAIAVVLSTSFLLCVALSTIGIALSTLARGNKYARVFLMAIFAAALVMGVFMAAGFASSVTRFPQTLRDPSAWIGYGAVGTVAATVAGLAFVVAGACLAHPEENTTLGLKLYTLVVLAVGLAWGGVLSSNAGDIRALWGVLMAVLVLCLLPFLSLVSDPERLGRRVRARVPERRFAALLVTPFLPGGGRNALFVVLFALLAGLAVVAIAFALPLSGRQVELCLAGTGVALAYTLSYLLVPTALAPWLGRTPSQRIGLRVGTLFLWVAGLIMPAVLGSLVGEVKWAKLDHPLNPVLVLGHVMSGRSLGAWLGWAAILVLLALGASAPRVVQGVVDVQRASLEREVRSKRLEAEGPDDAVPQP